MQLQKAGRRGVGANALARTSGRTQAIVFFTVFLDLVGFGIIIPIQPFFAESLGARPATVTLLAASYSLMQFLFAPAWGRLSDKIGRRPVMLASVLVTAVGYLLFGFASKLTWLFAARMLSGLGAANIGAAQAIVADSTSPEKRARGMGLIGAAFGLGFIFGPALGGIFSQISMATPMFVAAALSGLNFLIAWVALPETLPLRTPQSPQAQYALFSLTALRHAIENPDVKKLFFLYTIYTLAFSLMESSFGLFVQYSFTQNALDSGKTAAKYTAIALMIVGITATIVQGGLIGKLAALYGEWRLARFGFLTIMVTMFFIPLLGSFHRFSYFLVLMPLMAMGTGILNPSLTSLLSKSVGAHEQGGTLGLGQGLASLGRVGGPALAGFLFEAHAGAPFFVSSALLFGCLVLALRRSNLTAKSFP